jgi:hypothetical protein
VLLSKRKRPKTTGRFWTKFLLVLGYFFFAAFFAGFFAFFAIGSSPLKNRSLLPDALGAVCQVAASFPLHPVYE